MFGSYFAIQFLAPPSMTPLCSTCTPTIGWLTVTPTCGCTVFYPNWWLVNAPTNAGINVLTNDGTNTVGSRWVSILNQRQWLKIVGQRIDLFREVQAAVCVANTRQHPTNQTYDNICTDKQAACVHPVQDTGAQSRHDTGRCRLERRRRRPAVFEH